MIKTRVFFGELTVQFNSSWTEWMRFIWIVNGLDHCIEMGSKEKFTLKSGISNYFQLTETDDTNWIKPLLYEALPSFLKRLNGQNIVLTGLR